jgi:hypothetical protein
MHDVQILHKTSAHASQRFRPYVALHHWLDDPFLLSKIKIRSWNFRFHSVIALATKSQNINNDSPFLIVSNYRILSTTRRRHIFTSQ